jgi:hypothetical protein
VGWPGDLGGYGHVGVARAGRRRASPVAHPSAALLDDRTLITMRFTQGGPRDGQHHISNADLRVWIPADPGWYVLHHYHEASNGLGSRNGIATYAWQPDPASLPLRETT